MTFLPSLLLQSRGAAETVLGVGMLFVWIVIIIMIVGLWKLFVKAGEPGWAAIIPVYNLYVLLKVAGRPGWWLILFFVPIVNFVIAIIVAIDVARAFGQGIAFALILIILLGGIGYIVLGFGNYQYRKPATA